MNLKSRKKLIIILSIIVVLVLVGTVGALNGWFGGGGKIPKDTFTRGLVGYWNFDEGSGTTAFDSSGNNNKGTLTNGPKWTSGKVGGALKFDGIDDYVNVNLSSSLFNTIHGPITVELWFKADSLSGIGRLFSDDCQEVGFFRDSSTIYGEAYSNVSYGTILTNQWYHAVLTHAHPTGLTNTEIKLYINGELKAQTTLTITTENGYIDNPFHIGGDPCAANRYFNGTIDEVRVYNRALSAEEIRYHYNRGGPVGYWKFDEGSGTTTYDSTENHNNGTLYLGTSGNTTTSNAWTSGKFGSALSFDGVDDYVQTSGGISASNGITISLWTNWASLGGANPNTGLVEIDPTLTFSTGYHNFVYDDPGNFDFEYADSNGNRRWDIEFYYTPPTNKWIFLTVTLDYTTGQANFYVNGSFHSKDTAAYSIKPVSNKTVWIGRANLGGDNPYFKGLIDDVRIYNYARTPDEIRLDYNAGYAAKFGPQSSCNDDPGSCMTKGLVGYWGFEEAGGTTTYDGSGNGNNGTLTNGPKWTTGKIGGALSFDGKDDYVSVTSSSSIDNLVSAFSVEFRLNLPDVSPSKYIMDKGSFGFDEWAVALDEANGRLIFRNSNGSSTSDVRLENYFQIGWHHYVMVYVDADDKVYSYRDGVLIGSPSQTKSQVATTNKILNIMQKIPVYCYGILDEVRIYNRALSAEEIRYHYNRGAPVAYWKFDEGSGTTTYDATDNKNNGTLYLGTSGNTTTSNAWVSGKYGSALSFDGVDDRVTVPHSKSLDLVVNTTISFWLKMNNDAHDNYIDNLGKGTTYAIYWRSSDNRIYNQWNCSPTCYAFLTNAQLELGKWYYITYVMKYGSTSYVYINGALDSTYSNTPQTISSTSTLLIGVETNGLIDDVRIYNYARTPDEIRLDYNAGYAVRFGPQTSCDEDPGSCMTQGLVGYWSMDEGRGTTAYDTSGNGNNGTLTNGPKWTTGKVGGALSFDGSDDYVDCGSGANLDMGTNDFTVEVWAKASGGITGRGIINKGGWGSIGYAISEAYIPADKYYFVVTDSTSNKSVNLQIGPVFDWTHIVGVKKTNYIEAWVNGKKVGSWSGTIDSLSNPTKKFEIGRSFNPYYFNGIIDEVRIYNRALSAEEIRYHYNRGGPVGYWKFDEGSGTTTYDSTENHNNGTLYLGTSGNTTTSNAWVSGKYGSALSFDGVDDYVLVANNSSLDTSDDNVITEEAWIKLNSNRTKVGQVIRIDISYDLAIGTAGQIYYSPDGGAWIDSGLTVSNNVWTHVVTIHIESERKIYFYVNGKLGATKSDTGRAIGALGSQSLYIGSNSGNNYPFSGLIDDVRIYNYARTPAQILQDYNAGYGIYFK